jgi:hypothetical protein
VYTLTEARFDKHKNGAVIRIIKTLAIATGNNGEACLLDKLMQVK